MTSNKTPILVVITGPTATGKTKLAARLAQRLQGEIISADSRQVYRGMDIGTGKDLGDYQVDNEMIPHHLVDIKEPGYEYNVYEFQKDFLEAFRDIVERGKQPVLCGGTGLYVDAAISGYRMTEVPVNEGLREKLSHLSMDTLAEMLSQMRPLHNTTDIKDRSRLIRAIEIAQHEQLHQGKTQEHPPMKPVVFAVYFERSELRQRITTRLKARLEQGMIEEVKALLSRGLKPSMLRFYGLEYRYVTDYVTGQLSYEQMFQKLNTAIHQFAKRQMTWFRRMERKGTRIHWLKGTASTEEKISKILYELKGEIAWKQ